MRCFPTDVTDRKIEQDRLKLLANVFASAHEGIVITDARNNIIDANDAFTEITGYSRDEALGKNPNIFQSGRNDEAFYAELWSSLRKEGVWKGELWNRKKNGEEYVENVTISAICDESETP